MTKLSKIALFLCIFLLSSTLASLVKADPDTATLRPNASGTHTMWDAQYPASGSHWQKVDEATSDSDATYVRTQDGSGGSLPSYRADTFNLPDGQVAGGSTINSVTVYVRGRSISSAYKGVVETMIRTGGSNYFGSLNNPPTSYTLYSKAYANNPKTGSAWTVDEIDALEIGCYGRSGYSLRFGTYTYYPVRVTQVYCIVDYTEPSGQDLTFTLYEDFKVSSAAIHQKELGYTLTPTLQTFTTHIFQKECGFVLTSTFLTFSNLFFNKEKQFQLFSTLKTFTHMTETIELAFLDLVFTLFEAVTTRTSAEMPSMAQPIFTGFSIVAFIVSFASLGITASKEKSATVIIVSIVAVAFSVLAFASSRTVGIISFVIALSSLAVALLKKKEGDL